MTIQSIWRSLSERETMGSAEIEATGELISAETGH